MERNIFTCFHRWKMDHQNIFIPSYLTTRQICELMFDVLWQTSLFLFRQITTVADLGRSVQSQLFI